MSPQVAQPDASPAIVAVPETGRDDANTADATDGLMRDAPDQEPDQVTEKSLLAKAPKTLKGPNTSHIELESTKRVPAPRTSSWCHAIFLPRFPTHIWLYQAQRKRNPL
jgi:hypothetical protein